jgi:hypothetical protein
MCNNQCCGYWLLLNALTFAIKLYVNLFKERMKFQAKIDAIKEMDMHMKVKQLNVNMQKQVTIIQRPFLDFMYSFNPTKAHNMVILMLDPQFNDLS